MKPTSAVTPPPSHLFHGLAFPSFIICKPPPHPTPRTVPTPQYTLDTLISSVRYFTSIFKLYHHRHEHDEVLFLCKAG